MGDIDLLFRVERDRLERALSRMGGADIANDAVAEAFAQLLRRGDAVRDPRRWVWVSAFRIARGLLKARGRFDSGDGHERAVRADAGFAEVIDLLDALTPAQRAALWLQDYAGFTSVEAAAFSGYSATALRVHLCRARLRLAALCRDEAIAQSA